MGFWGAIVLIVLIGCITSVLTERYKAQRAWAERGADAPPPGRRAEEIEQEVLALKQRVAVLERIATDDRKRIGLADEIEQLRDGR